MSDKHSEVKRRRQAIGELLECEVVEDQERLVELLDARYGIETTQAAISRDFKELGIVKKTERGRRVYANPGEDPTKQLLQLGVLGIAHNGSAIAVKTRPGLADFVGDMIDAQGVGVLGCIAGENTVMVWPSDAKKIASTTKQLAKLLQYKQPLREPL